MVETGYSPEKDTTVTPPDELEQRTEVPAEGLELKDKLIKEGVFLTGRTTIINQHYEVPLKMATDNFMKAGVIMKQLAHDMSMLPGGKDKNPISYVNDLSQHLKTLTYARKKKYTADADATPLEGISVEGDFSIDVYATRPKDNYTYRIRWNTDNHGKLISVVLIAAVEGKPEANLPLEGVDPIPVKDEHGNIQMTPAVARRELIVAQVLTPEEAEELLPEILGNLQKNKYEVGDIKWKWNKGMSLVKRDRTNNAQVNGQAVRFTDGVLTHPPFCKIDATEAFQIKVDQKKIPARKRVTFKKLAKHISKYEINPINRNILTVPDANGHEQQAVPRATPLPLYDFYPFFEHLRELFPEAELEETLACEVEFNDKRMIGLPGAVKKWMDEVHSLPLDISRSVETSSEKSDHALAAD